MALPPPPVVSVVPTLAPPPVSRTFGSAHQMLVKAQHAQIVTPGANGFKDLVYTTQEMAALNTLAYGMMTEYSVLPSDIMPSLCVYLGNQIAITLCALFGNRPMCMAFDQVHLGSGDLLRKPMDNQPLFCEDWQQVFTPLTPDSNTGPGGPMGKVRSDFVRRFSIELDQMNDMSLPMSTLEMVRGLNAALRHGIPSAPLGENQAGPYRGAETMLAAALRRFVRLFGTNYMLRVMQLGYGMMLTLSRYLLLTAIPWSPYRAQMDAQEQQMRPYDHYPTHNSQQTVEEIAIRQAWAFFHRYYHFLNDPIGRRKKLNTILDTFVQTVLAPQGVHVNPGSNDAVLDEPITLEISGSDDGVAAAPGYSVVISGVLMVGALAWRMFKECGNEFNSRIVRSTFRCPFRTLRLDATTYETASFYGTVIKDDSLPNHDYPAFTDKEVMVLRHSSYDGKTYNFAIESLADLHSTDSRSNDCLKMRTIYALVSYVGLIQRPYDGVHGPSDRDSGASSEGGESSGPPTVSRLIHLADWSAAPNELTVTLGDVYRSLLCVMPAYDETRYRAVINKMWMDIPADCGYPDCLQLRASFRFDQLSMLYPVPYLLDTPSEAFVNFDYCNLHTLCPATTLDLESTDRRLSALRLTYREMHRVDNWPVCAHQKSPFVEHSFLWGFEREALTPLLNLSQTQIDSKWYTAWNERCVRLDQRQALSGIRLIARQTLLIGNIHTALIEPLTHYHLSGQSALDVGLVPTSSAFENALRTLANWVQPVHSVYALVAIAVRRFASPEVVYARIEKSLNRDSDTTNSYQIASLLFRQFEMGWVANTNGTTVPYQTTYPITAAARTGVLQLFDEAQTCFLDTIGPILRVVFDAVLAFELPAERFPWPHDFFMLRLFSLYAPDSSVANIVNVLADAYAHSRTAHRRLLDANCGGPLAQATDVHENVTRGTTPKGADTALHNYSLAFDPWAPCVVPPMAHLTNLNGKQDSLRERTRYVWDTEYSRPFWFEQTDAVRIRRGVFLPSRFYDAGAYGIDPVGANANDRAAELASRDLPLARWFLHTVVPAIGAGKLITVTNGDTWALTRLCAGRYPTPDWPTSMGQAMANARQRLPNCRTVGYQLPESLGRLRNARTDPLRDNRDFITECEYEYERRANPLLPAPPIPTMFPHVHLQTRAGLYRNVNALVDEYSKPVLSETRYVGLLLNDILRASTTAFEHPGSFLPVVMVQSRVPSTLQVTPQAGAWPRLDAVLPLGILCPDLIDPDCSNLLPIVVHPFYSSAALQHHLLRGQRLRVDGSQRGQGRTLFVAAAPGVPVQPVYAQQNAPITALVGAPRLVDAHHPHPALFWDTMATQTTAFGRRARVIAALLPSGRGTGGGGPGGGGALRTAAYDVFYSKKIGMMTICNYYSTPGMALMHSGPDAPHLGLCGMTFRTPVMGGEVIVACRAQGIRAVFTGTTSESMVSDNEFQWKFRSRAHLIDKAPIASVMSMPNAIVGNVDNCVALRTLDEKWKDAQVPNLRDYVLANSFRALNMFHFMDLDSPYNKERYGGLAITGNATNRPELALRTSSNFSAMLISGSMPQLWAMTPLPTGRSRSSYPLQRSEFMSRDYAKAEPTLPTTDRVSITCAWLQHSAFNHLVYTTGPDAYLGTGTPLDCFADNRYSTSLENLDSTLLVTLNCGGPPERVIPITPAHFVAANADYLMRDAPAKVVKSNRSLVATAGATLVDFASGGPTFLEWAKTGPMCAEALRGSQLVDVAANLKRDRVTGHYLILPRTGPMSEGGCLNPDNFHHIATEFDRRTTIVQQMQHVI